MDNRDKDPVRRAKLTIFWILVVVIVGMVIAGTAGAGIGLD